MNKKINVINENGENVEAEVVLYFNLEETGKDYVIYTFGEVDKDQMQTMHASVVTKNGDEQVFDVIPDEEWETIKEIMREVIRNEEA